MHLEPDDTYGYKVLESVKQARNEIEPIENFDVNLKKHNDVLHLEYQNIEKEMYRFKMYYNMMKSWTMLKQQKRNVCTYLLQHGYRRIAVYGLGVHGHMFYQEFQAAGVSCAFAVDRLNQEKMKQEKIPVFGIEETWPDCDLMVITVVDKYYEIFNKIKEKLSCPIVSLYEVVVEAGSE